MQLISGIDLPCPLVGDQFHFQGQWTQHDCEGVWQEDFRLAKAAGLDWLRYGWPWSMVEVAPGEFDWRVLDARLAFAREIGLEITLVVAHFNFPMWLRGSNGEHAALAPQLPERLAFYTEQLMARYRPNLVVPLVETSMDCFQRCISGKWQPHFQRKHSVYAVMWKNLLEAFRASSAVIRKHGGRVMACEPVTELKKLGLLSDAIDVMGLDYYPHFHGKITLRHYLKVAQNVVQKPIALTEYGVPESFQRGTGRADETRPFAPGHDVLRAEIATELREILRRALDAGIEIEAAGWYPFIDNFWAAGLSSQPPGEGDRAGLIDFSRQPDGSLRRVPCEELIGELRRLKELA